MELQELKVALIQTDISWENPSANLAHLEELIWKINSSVDLIVLPEMFNTGFSMNPETVAEVPNFNTYRWLKNISLQFSCAVTGSYAIREGKNYYNRLYFIDAANEREQFYNKKHLFFPDGEAKVYTPGDQNIIIEHKGWKIFPSICFDLRFAEDFQNTGYLYDVLINVANWPFTRVDHWKALLKGRAIENQVYAIGVNRVGESPRGMYNGQSNAYDYNGDPILSYSPKEEIFTVTLKKSKLDSYRIKFPFKAEEQF